MYVEGVGNWKLTYEHSLSSKMWSVLLVLYRLPYFVPDEYDMTYTQLLNTATIQNVLLMKSNVSLMKEIIPLKNHICIPFLNSFYF